MREYSSIRFTRGIFFSFEEFLHSYTGNEKSQADFSYITGTVAPVGPYHFTKRTIINDLTVTEEQIFRAYNDTTRQYISSLMRAQLCSHQFIMIPSEADVRLLAGQSENFTRTMGLPAVNINYMLALNKANRLHMSYVRDHNNVILAAHGYRLSDVRAELAYSFRAIEPGADKERQKLLSKANRYSHYKDMLQLKSLGFAAYDFGGLSDGADTNTKWTHIDEFKMFFGGSVQVYYNSILYNSLKSRAYLKLRGPRL
jgi:hypothetical protein